jgi:Spy/CpxP family protein refolding chaperone
MKRHLFLGTLLAVFMTGTIAHAQDTTQTPIGQRQGGARGAGGGQRQGAPPADPQQVEAFANTVRAARIQTVPTMTITTAWWTNNALVTRLGLTDVQKSRIESTFEAHRQNLVSTKDQLEKQEAQLSKLLEAESIDRSAVFTQINRVIQARGEMERASATMTLEMREQLTRAQWTELQLQPGVPIMTVTPAGELPLIAVPVAPGGRGARGGGGRGPIPPQQ